MGLELCVIGVPEKGREWHSGGFNGPGLSLKGSTFFPHLGEIGSTN